MHRSVFIASSEAVLACCATHVILMLAWVPWIQILKYLWIIKSENVKGILELFWISDVINRYFSKAADDAAL